MSKRRKILTLLGIIGTLPQLSAVAALLPTPRQTAGPFYPRTLPADNDNDLTQVAGRDRRAKGKTTDLSGRVLDLNGRPMRGVRVEIWQCDANGRYHHPLDRKNAPLDENFQGHGSTWSDTEGRYRFRTIRPVPYPGRTPHIHAAVFPESHEPLVTQLYIDGEPQNARDFLFKRIPDDRRSLVVSTLAPGTDGAEFSISYDLILNITPQQA